MSTTWSDEQRDAISLTASLRFQADIDEFGDRLHAVRQMHVSAEFDRFVFLPKLDAVVDWVLRVTLASRAELDVALEMALAYRPTLTDDPVRYIHKIQKKLGKR